MGCLITSSNKNCNNYTVAGIKRLFMTNSEWIDDFFFDLSDTELTTIDRFQTNNDFVAWYEFSVYRNFTNGFENLNISSQKNLFNKTLDLTFLKLSPTNRFTINQMIKAKPIIVFLDNNDEWWCIGEDQPCKIKEYKAQTSTIDGTSDYRLLFECDSKYPMRAVDSTYAYINIAGQPQYECNCDNLVDFVLQVSANCSLFDLQNCPLEN